MTAVTCTTQNNRQTVAFGQELTIFQVDDIHQAMLLGIDFEKDVYLDLSQVKEFDTTGVQLLIALNMSLTSSGKKAYLSAASEDAQSCLALFNITDLFASAHA
ncbi:lipid asymmetry maintenance protein MlaB [Teredinibacter turnerae]|uniref:STAS domain-containing protein n=1 Tax=Teredinibacter turnerae TaxID=2426 RepID=UPI00035D9360|nr:STAS domain-containing protein [Teredinibacter turnerae]